MGLGALALDRSWLKVKDLPRVPVFRLHAESCHIEVSLNLLRFRLRRYLALALLSKYSLGVRRLKLLVKRRMSISRGMVAIMQNQLISYVNIM